MNNTSNVTVETSPLEPARTPEEYQIHKWALEWGLAEPIIIDRAEDIKSKVNWQELLEPFHHQVQNLMTFCRRLPVTLIADDVGLGKTISAGLVLSELMVRNRVSRALVICPSILGPQWIEELESKFGIFGRYVTGSELTSAIRGSADVVATTYQSASSRLEHIPPGSFDMLILDEAHKLRNLHGTKKPPLIASRVRKVLEQRLFKYVLMLTATPIQNRLWDLYSLIDLLSVAKGHRNPFGTSDEFNLKFIADAAAKARMLNPKMKEEFQRVLRQYLVRTRRVEVKLAFPEREVKLFRVKANRLDQKLQRLVADNIQHANGLVQSSLATAMMSSPQALLSQLTNMGNRDQRWATLAAEVEDLIENEKESSKLGGLVRIVDELRGANPKAWRMVVFTTRKETQRIIGEALTANGIPHAFIQGGQPVSNAKTVSRFTMDPPQIHVIVSTDAGAEGVNLQAGNVVVNYDLPWNPMIVEQRIGRVQRLASRHGHVVIINLAVADSPEENVVGRLLEKLQTIADTVGDIETILEASSGEGDVNSQSFESTIRELVVKALKGQDVDAATKMAVESIDNAKKLFESQREEIDRTLGSLNELHQSGPAMPRLKPTQPAVTFESFVHSALTADGYEIQQSGSKRFQMKKDRQPEEEFTFDEKTWREVARPGMFHGMGPKLYFPGKPHFERLVQRWTDRAGHHTIDLRSSTQSLVEAFAQEWLTRIDGAELSGCRIRSRETEFQGELQLKVTARNSVDSYEKLVSVKVNPASHSPIPVKRIQSARVLLERVDPKEISESILREARREAATDRDVSEFCRFYSERLEEELKHAGDDAGRRRKVEADFSPDLHATAVGISGVQFETCHAELSFTIDGEGDYSVGMQILPAAKKILQSDLQWSRCGETGRQVPTNCLTYCEVSKQLVLCHLTVTSEETGRVASRRFAQTCPISGRTVFEDEFAVSDISGQRAALGEFKSSKISGRRGLDGEVGTCEVTGDLVLVDELAVSEVSGRKFRIDQEVRSAVSGTSGHASEFLTCAVTGEPLLEQETARSDLSGMVARQDLLLKSERAPHRLGLETEMVICAESGKTLLRDETGTCAVTGKCVDRNLLQESDDSGRLALPGEMVECEFSGRRILPDESVFSSVSKRRISIVSAVRSDVSNRPAAPDEVERCEITGALVFADELVQSEVSGKRFRVDQAVTSKTSGKVAHESECQVCEFTKRKLLPEDSERSDFSGKLTDRDDLLTSDASGRRGVSSECTRCQETKALLLRDEVGISDASGLAVDKRLLVKSSASDRQALRRELVKCQYSGAMVLPDETRICAVSGKIADRRFLGKSEVSGAVALPEYIETCAETGKRALVTELIQCGLSGERVLKSETETCANSSTVGRRSQMVQSELSGRWVVRSQSRRCSSKKIVVAADEATLCHWHDVYFVDSEISTCQRTGLTFWKKMLDANRVMGHIPLIAAAQKDMSERRDLVSWIRKQADGHLEAAVHVWAIESARKRHAFLLVDLQRAFGLYQRYAVVVIENGEVPRIIGRVTANKARDLKWTLLWDSNEPGV